MRSGLMQTMIERIQLSSQPKSRPKSRRPETLRCHYARLLVAINRGAEAREHLISTTAELEGKALKSRESERGAGPENGGLFVSV